MKLFVLLLCSAPLFAQTHPLYEAWRKGPHIKVGVKKPTSVVELSSNASLLLLDGDKVVGTLEPAGKFLVISTGIDSGGSQRWLQLRAAKNKQLLQRDMKRLKKTYPDISLALKKSKGGYFALRLGPLKTVADGQQWRAHMVKEGFKDAFLMKDRKGFAFQWVDKRFDKRTLNAQDPALVHNNPNKPLTYQGTGYRGILRFRAEGDKIQVINQLPLETYLRGVVPSELGPSAFPHLEAQKAQAVAARTYTLKNMGRFARKGYDICDTPACQAYEGTKNEDPLSDRAVKETEGMVLLFDGELIDALYTSTCGGTTEDVENVFPGRAEPYLRAKSGYVGDYPRFDLPAKPVDTDRYQGQSEDLAVRALLWGFPEIPEMKGYLNGDELTRACKRLAWVLGNGAPKLPETPLSHRNFWRALAEMPFFKASADRQVNDADLGVLLRHYEVPEDVARFAGLAIRYDLIHRDQLRSFGHTGSVSRAFAYEVLLGLCEVLGPEPQWRRYRLEQLNGPNLKLSRQGNERELNLNRIDAYITDVGGRLEFVEAPHLEEWDRIYTLQEPFPARLLKVKESGVVASVDRFSAYDSWLEKKTVAELEKRARRYVRGLSGLRDVRILKRSETGRVTQLAFDAASGTHKVTGLNIRWSLGVRDNLFDILPGYREGRLVHITVLGRGWGHGVGMSQVGAFSLARMGWDFEKILTYYYTGVEIRPFVQDHE